MMKVEKKIICNLNKCYAMAELTDNGEHCFLVAAEKKDPCYLCSEDGEVLETVWTEPGGIMTMQQVPGVDGQFLSTQRFYSPNDSKNASIAVVTHKGKNDWEIRTLCDAPFVHRFGILERNGTRYLLVCCLKSGHEYKNDWRVPGACFASVLPADLSPFNAEHQLTLTKIKGGMLRNHGYRAMKINGQDVAIVGCEEGTFLFTPPAKPQDDWEIKQLCGVPASDSILLDFDGDGKLELGTISPFHGASLTVYHLDAFGNYVPQWKLPLPEADTEFLHSTWSGTLAGREAWVVGWRKGTRQTIAITYENGAYQTEIIDSATGCANLMHFVNRDGKDVLVATNREIDEAAMYIVTE